MKKYPSIYIVALFAFLVSVQTGCASHDIAVKPLGNTRNNNSIQALPTPKISMNPSEQWIEIRKAQANLAAGTEDETTGISDSLRLTIGRIQVLYNIAVDALRDNPTALDREKAKNALTEAIDLLNNLLDRDELEGNHDFWTLALYVIQTYDTHIQPLNELDSDNPALAVHERLFGNTDNIVVDDNLFLGISLPKTEIPLELNYQVKQFITYFSKQLHKVFQKYLDRAEIYFPMIDQIVAEEGVPRELIYLSLIESGVNPKAHSRANATGIWQFIRSTGRLYNLHSNAWFDERQDIFKATRSSMRHLKDLHNIYGDWYLALAAYNAGPGKVSGSLRRTQDKSFWGITPYLRRETKEYVPRYIAASIIAMYPEHFGFSPMNYQPVQAPDIVKVSDCIPLSTIANYSNVTLDTLQFLNPELKRDVTPPGYKNYELKVPSGTGEAVASSIAAIPESERLYFLVHKTTKSQPLSHIAKTYNVHPSSIKQINGLASATVPKGRVLFIPTSAVLASQTSYSLNEISDESAERGKRSRVSKKGHKHSKRIARVQKRHRKAISAVQAPGSSDLAFAGTTR